MSLSDSIYKALVVEHNLDYLLKSKMFGILNDNKSPFKKKSQKQFYQGDWTTNLPRIYDKTNNVWVNPMLYSYIGYAKALRSTAAADFKFYSTRDKHSIGFLKRYDAAIEDTVTSSPCEVLAISDFIVNERDRNNFWLDNIVY